MTETTPTFTPYTQCYFCQAILSNDDIEAGNGFDCETCGRGGCEECVSPNGGERGLFLNSESPVWFCSCECKRQYKQYWNRVGKEWLKNQHN
jgi:hypothetical protein